MRAIRQPFARQTLQPVRVYEAQCGECGNSRHTPKTRRPYAWAIRIEPDAGRSNTTAETFDSWDCYAAYFNHDPRKEG